tara:strand:+ start:10504 stop:12066 length:1563 start_codon:yes stop_codon:yes gene_type:complete
MQQKILILDFGSQYSQLIARRVRETNVYCEIHPFDITEEFITEFSPNGIILSGGPASTTDSETPRAPQIIFKLDIPILGICYGMQTMAAQLGGTVEISNVREFGHAKIYITEQTKLLDHINDSLNDNNRKSLNVWMSHGDKVTKLPNSFKIIASNDAAPIAAMANEEKKYYGLQFHPEVTHTPKGKEIISHFVHNICNLGYKWNMPEYMSNAVNKIRSKVGKENVILGLSGGVDSSVAAALIHLAIGKQLTCVFVDNGLLRLKEAEQVMNTFSKNIGLNIIHIDASKIFIKKLHGITDPEQKRRIIGREFVEVFQLESSKINNAKWLAQGTIYPDVIESAGNKNKKANTIKSHHNVGGLPDTLHLKLLEPLRELFKDEVRELGLALGLTHEIVFRHPFPGPGLGVRILGEIKHEYAELLRQADAIYVEELRSSGWYEKISQAFAVFLPIKSVGVMGDGRTYEHVIALRAVKTQDFMTAEWVELPYTLLGKISSRIINEVPGINRVVYDISGKPPATIEWE